LQYQHNKSRRVDSQKVPAPLGLYEIITSRMTALNFLLLDDRVYIAMDTLSIDPVTKRPGKFVSKIMPLPHLRGVLCGTGALQLILDWYVMIQAGAHVRDMVHLNDFAPEALRTIAQRYASDNTGSTTIYHFAYDSAVERFRGFVYRSEKQFVSEELPRGIGTKPPLQVDLPESMELPNMFIDYVTRQRANDRAGSFEDRVGIGGEIHYAVLWPEQFVISPCYTFDDYEACMREILFRGAQQARATAG
jgi:hypothetical protein